MKGKTVITKTAGRLLTVLLTVCMMLGLIPAAFAADDFPGGQQPVFTEQVLPYIDDEGRYVPGVMNHYEITWEGQTHYYLPSSDPSGSFTEVTEDDISLSWFEFSDNGDSILRYTGPLDYDQTICIDLPEYAPGSSLPIESIGDGSSAFIVPADVPEDKALEITDRGNITWIKANAFKGLKDLTLTLYSENENGITVDDDAFKDCSGVTVRCYHTASNMSDLTGGVHDDWKGQYTVEYLDEHHMIAYEVFFEDDYSAATLEIHCDRDECGLKIFLDAEVKVEPDFFDPDSFAVSAKAYYEGEVYELSTGTGFITATLSYEVGNAVRQYSFRVPKACREDYAVFKFSSLDLSGAGLPAGAAFVSWTDGDNTYGPDDRIQLYEDKEFSAQWASTWNGVREALQEDNAVVYLYNSIQADEDDLPLTVPAGARSALILRGYDVDRNLSAAAEDGYAIRADGTLYINIDPAMPDETYSHGTVKGGNNTGIGGGIYVGGTLYAHDITISGNAGARGGGVYAGGTFGVSGKVNILENKLSEPAGDETASASNVYLPAGKTIQVIGSLDPGTKIGVTMAGPGVITSGLKGNEGEDAWGSADNFVSDNENFNVIINADGEAELVPAAEPEFDGHAVLLTGQIGLQFFLEFPEGMSPADYPGAYVTFEGNGIDGEVRHAMPETTAVINGTDTGKYVFQVNLSSVQMADMITLIFHYTAAGEEKTVTGEAYSVEEYIKWGLENLTGKGLAIVQALADYGYYAQPYLSEQNGWIIGEDHEEMTTKVTDAYDYDEITAASEDCAVVKGTNDKITKVSYKLRFASEIALRVTLTPAAGVKLSTVLVDEEEATPKKSGKTYIIDFANIKATALTDDHTIVAEGAETIVSPMSYVYGILSSADTSGAAKDLVCALYNFAQACNMKEEED